MRGHLQEAGFCPRHREEGHNGARNLLFSSYFGEGVILAKVPLKGAIGGFWLIKNVFCLTHTLEMFPRR